MSLFSVSLAISYMRTPFFKRHNAIVLTRLLRELKRQCVVCWSERVGRNSKRYSGGCLDLSGVKEQVAEQANAAVRSIIDRRATALRSRPGQRRARLVPFGRELPVSLRDVGSARPRVVRVERRGRAEVACEHVALHALGGAGRGVGVEVGARLRLAREGQRGSRGRSGRRRGTLGPGLHAAIGAATGKTMNKTEGAQQSSNGVRE